LFNATTIAPWLSALGGIASMFCGITAVRRRHHQDDQVRGALAARAHRGKCL